MTANPIFHPLFGMFVLVAVVLLLLALARSRFLAKSGLNMEVFKNTATLSVSPVAERLSRNFSNLFEMPVLFYVVIFLVYLTQRVDPVFVWLAWAYVVGRFGHSLVQITYNRVLHRFVFFALSNVVLSVLWIRWFVGVF